MQASGTRFHLAAAPGAVGGFEVLTESGDSVAGVKLGYATPLDSLETLPRVCDAAADAGFDFLEFPLAPLGLLEGRGAEAASVLRSLSLPCLVAQSFIPKGLPLTGPEVNESRIRTYLSHAADLCHAVGARKAVFGAAWARNVPDGWDRDRARDQLLQAFSWTAESFAGSGCDVGIEPQNLKEANIVRTLAEAVGYAVEVNHDSLKVVIDFYHLDEEQTPLAEIGTYGDWIIHVQVADSDRQHPGTGSYDYPEFARQLASIGYDDTLSVEVMHHLSDLDIAASANFLRALWPANALRSRGIA